jgi:hypothetical protein
MNINRMPKMILNEKKGRWKQDRTSKETRLDYIE